MSSTSLAAAWNAGPSADRILLPLQRRSAAMTSPAAFSIAAMLDPTSPRLSELLGSGSARNLSEAFQQLNPSEQNALRERWGRSLDELISLSSERDATIFHHGLLEVGRRLEDADQVELASAVYSTLVAGNAPRPPLTLRGGDIRGEITEGENHVPPLRVRGGQEGLLPGVLASAQSRLNAINGVGDWRARLAFNLERLPTNATRWDMLFAMSGAGLVFRGIRLAATARWASSFESAFALNAAATSTAFVGETLAFTGFGRLFGIMAGNHYDWSAEGTFNEWAGGAAMLLGLKAMGGIFGNLSERWAAGESAFARVTRVVASQAGMFSGIVLGNRLAELGGFHPERHGDTWLTDGLTTLLEFNIAGRLQRSAGGPGLTHLEGRMEAYTRSMMASEYAAVSRSKDRLLRGHRLLPGWDEIFAPELVTPEGIWMAVGNKDPLTQTAVFSVRQNPEDPVLPPRAKASPVFVQGQEFTLPLIPEGAFRVQMYESVGDPFLRMTQRMEEELRHQPNSSFVFVYEGKDANESVRGALRIEMHRILRDHGINAPHAIAWVFPEVGDGLVFQRSLGRVQVQNVSLRNSSIPPPPSSSTPVRPSSVPPPPSSGSGLEGRSFGSFFEIRAAARELFSPRAEQVGILPSLRLTRGTLGLREIQQLAPMVDTALNSRGRKWMLTWSEAGGGRVEFQRQGDRLLAKLRGPRVEEETYLLLPHPTEVGQYQALPRWQLYEYGFDGWEHYRERTDAKIVGLYGFLRLETKSSVDKRLEDGSQRGQQLALAAQHLLRALERGSSDPEFTNQLFQLHRVLEEAYLHFDVDTLTQFKERLGRFRLERYEAAIAKINQGLLEKNEAPLASFQGMNLEAEGIYAVPRQEKLREAWLHAVFDRGSGTRIVQQNPGLLADPVQLGQRLGTALQRSLRDFPADLKALQALYPGKSLDQIFGAQNITGAPETLALRETLLGQIQMIAEFSRILYDGVRLNKGPFHRQLVKAAVLDNLGAMKLYSDIHSALAVMEGPRRIHQFLSPAMIQKILNPAGLGRK